MRRILYLNQKKFQKKNFYIELNKFNLVVLNPAIDISALVATNLNTGSEISFNKCNIQGCEIPVKDLEGEDKYCDSKASSQGIIGDRLPSIRNFFASAVINQI